MRLEDSFNPLMAAAVEAALERRKNEQLELQRSILDPSEEQRWAAICEIWATMSPEYQQLVNEDVERFFDTPDAEEFKYGFTGRLLELAKLRTFQCPRALALPPQFCAAYLACEPGDWLRWDWWECVDCHLAHPVVVHGPIPHRG